MSFDDADGFAIPRVAGVIRHGCSVMHYHRDDTAITGSFTAQAQPRLLDEVRRGCAGNMTGCTVCGPSGLPSARRYRRLRRARETEARSVLTLPRCLPAPPTWSRPFSAASRPNAPPSVRWAGFAAWFAQLPVGTVVAMKRVAHQAAQCCRGVMGT
jgi:hypothetical protein